MKRPFAGNSTRAVWILGCLFLSGVLDSEAVASEPMAGDAALADVFFVDRQTGWAVGDRGTIWHTSDGGERWLQQQSPVSCRLESVFFLNERHGWAVGGKTQPYTLATQAAVLRTSDGGQTWTSTSGLVLPWLHKVQFFDAMHGMALGLGTSLHPSGLFATNDGGQSWRSMPGDQRAHWLTGDFVDGQTGALAGEEGQFATVVRRKVVHAPLASPVDRTLRSMRLTGPVEGWLVGDGALIMATQDSGRSWQTVATNFPPFIAKHFDFYAVAVQGPHVWVAGSPGSRIFHSADGGHRWQSQATGQTVPLRAITFVDAEHGWAVGSLGTILATADGGHSWQVQRAGGRRAAMLTLVGQGTEVPLELLAKLSAAEGYLAAIDILTQPEGKKPMAVREAFLAAGASEVCMAWRFPLPPDELAAKPKQILAALHRANDGKALDRINARLVRQIRMWRPEIVFTSGKSFGSHLGPLMQPWVLQAMDAAADPTQHIELATGVGLPPWQVKKVYGLLPSEAHGSETIVTHQFVPQLGQTLADWTTTAHGLLQASYVSPPDKHTFDLLQQSATVGPKGRGFFAGIPLAPGGEARRPITTPLGNLSELRRKAQRRKHVQQLLQRTAGNAAWAGQVVNLTEGLDAKGGGAILFQLAQGYKAQGRLDLAADTFYLLARRYPKQALADKGLLWLVQFYASGEAAFVREQAAGGGRNLRAVESEPSQVEPTDASTSLDPNAAPAVGLSSDGRLQRAIQLGKYLRHARHALYAEPSVRFPLAVAHRQLGYANRPKRYFLTLQQLPKSSPWRQCAEAEQWLAEPNRLPPQKPIVNCHRTPVKPHLDGQLDDPCWQAAQPIELTGLENSEKNSPVDNTSVSVVGHDEYPPKTPNPEVFFAYDQQFLYLAARCPKMAGGTYEADDRPRVRDTDLTEHDRLTLRMDVDRDYTSYFELTVDHRGWTHESCWGDETWNPSWFVATHSNETDWTIEVAIPLAAFVSKPPVPKHVWAVGIRRIVPRVGLATWTGSLGSTATPDQFGLMIFE